MKFEVLTDEEFKKFAYNHEQASFHQTLNWATLKAFTNWEKHLVGVKKNNKVIAASLILAKQTPIKKKMFYAPRGFLIDYDNFELLKFFTEGLKEYAKKNKAIFVKIDPYISYQERDLYGNIVEGGKNNKNAFNNLISLGYKHKGFNLMQEELQPRWIFVTQTKNTTVDEIMKNMDPKTRQILRKNERNKIKVREIGLDELEKFKKIMEHTGERRGFIDRPLAYYEHMYKAMHDDNFIKVMLAELDTDELIDEYKLEIKNINEEIKQREDKYNLDPSKVNKNKYDQKQNQAKNEINRIEKNIEHIKNLKDTHGKILTLGGIIFLINNKEVLSSVGGSYDELMEFQSAYTLHFAGMKYAIENNYDRYNFYGITGIFDESNPLFGLYSFKRDFGGKVVELIGEFDLIIDKSAWILYKNALKVYSIFKKIKK
ncbi:MAG: peptidoglycan bridge formation glycyltransferase FemA/FemB family protein [Bacilli bacterium]|nr:peptidoglycan bridge formation glycyltransferase FemA/FemB family protein [Bacilli bacterium]